MTCKICSAPAVHFDGVIINPPLCPVHYDLAVLVEYLEGRGEPVTVEIVQRELARARSHSDQWTLTGDQVGELLPAYLQKMSPEAGPAPAAQPELAAAGNKIAGAPPHAGHSATTPETEVSQ